MYARCVYWRRVWSEHLSAVGAGHQFRTHVESDEAIFTDRMRRLRNRRFIRTDVSGARSTTLAD